MVACSHSHAFVRRNAVLSVFAISKSFEHLLPDAPELVEKVLLEEADPSARRNAFLMLFQASQERAVAFLVDNLDQVGAARPMLPPPRYRPELTSTWGPAG